VLAARLMWSKQSLIDSGCGVAHTVAHTTPVREDLSSIRTQTLALFMENLSSPFFQTTDLKQFDSFVYCDVKFKKIILKKNKKLIDNINL
jgi:hypothetical protein